ncbi:MAG: THUMP domain-containing protein [Candidatus Nitrosocosmicus sp.]
MEFNFIATTFRYKEDALIDEMGELFAEFDDLNSTIRTTGIDGLVVGVCLKNPVDFVSFLREKLKDVPWEIRYVLRFIPIEHVVMTGVTEIKNMSVELMKRIPVDDSFKILIEKRHTSLKKDDIINAIGPFISSKVDLTNPDWILLIEVVGKYAGLSIIKHDVLFSSMIEKRTFE